jgi:hypothetical protein
MGFFFDFDLFYVWMKERGWVCSTVSIKDFKASLTGISADMFMKAHTRTVMLEVRILSLESKVKNLEDRNERAKYYITKIQLKNYYEEVYVVDSLCIEALIEIKEGINAGTV